MLDNIKIGPKLTGGFIAVALIAGIIGTVGIINIRNINNADTFMYNHAVKPMASFTKMVESYQRARVYLRDMVIAQNPAAINEQASNMNAMLADMQRYGREFQQAEGSESMRKAFVSFDQAFVEYKKVMDQVAVAARANKDEECLDLIRGVGVSVTAGVIKSMEEITALNEAQAKTIAENNTRLSKNAAAMMGWFIAIGVIVALALGILLTLSVTVPLSKGVEMMSELSRGHLGARLKMRRGDEIGELSGMMDSFADRLQGNVVESMKKIAEGNLDVRVKAADSGDEIAPALEKIVAALRLLIDESVKLAKAAVEGKLSVRGDVSRFSGGYREIVQGVNNTLDAVINPVNEAAQVLEKVAAKDMTARVCGIYQGDHAKIKDALNSAVDNLDRSLQQVSMASGQVASASTQISKSSQSLAQGASEQASALEEVSSGLQEMTSMTRQNTNNAREAKGLADSARAGSDKGLEGMGKLSAAVTRIKKSSDDTSKIIKTIDEIAFQTNLLALNAAVEAARAGEAGKGFAVVAEEVRNLAMRSSEAAKNTANLIEEVVKNVEAGVELNQQTMQNLTEINKQSQKVSEVMSEIAAASEQQSTGVEQINTAIQQMSQVTQQNAANSEESASASEELTSQAQEMRSMVETFKISGGGDVHFSVQPRHQHKLEHSCAAETKKPAQLAHHDPKKVIPLHDDEVVLREF